MYKVIVFAGTTEGYEISRFLGENQIPVLACVATEYGSKSLKESSTLHVQAGRLDENEMKELFSREKPELVLDATHPYAAEVTRNIRKACEETEVSYTRILRTGSGRVPEGNYRKRPSDNRKQGTGGVYFCSGL